MGVVGDGTQHGPYYRLAQHQLTLFTHAVGDDGRHPQAAELQMVGMGDLLRQDVPDDAVLSVQLPDIMQRIQRRQRPAGNCPGTLLFIIMTGGDHQDHPQPQDHQEVFVHIARSFRGSL